MIVQISPLYILVPYVNINWYMCLSSKYSSPNRVCNVPVTVPSRPSDKVKDAHVTKTVDKDVIKYHK